MAVDLPLTEAHWKGDFTSPLAELTLGDLLRQLARESPDRVGFIEAPRSPLPVRSWTYAQLLQAAEGSARALLRHFRPGEKIAVWAPNCAEWVLLQHAAALAGLVLVTVNPAYLGEEVHHVLVTSEAVGIFHAPGHRGVDMAAVLAGVRTRLPLLRQAIDLSRWAEFAAAGDASIALPDVAPQDVIQIQFTSGTTGRPKGARLHHRGLINASRFAAQRVGFPRGGVWASAMPLFHVGGSAGSQLGALTSAGTFVLQPVFDAGDMLRIVETHRVNHIHAVPTMVLRMLDHPDLPTRDLGSMRTLMSGGSLVPESLVLRAHAEMGARISITYGQTEANGVVCQTSPDDTLERQTTTIGRPAVCAEVKIADPETGAVRAVDEPGEIWVRGYQVMRGYFNLPPDAQNAVTEDGWLRTGDAAAMDTSGYLRITGRLKDCIIRGGENIYPREIEELLERHPAVAEAQVVGEADAQMGEVVVACIRLREGIPAPSATELHGLCRAHLASYKAPARWYYVQEFPTTAAGKVRKFVLREQIARGELVAQPFMKLGRTGAGT